MGKAVSRRVIVLLATTILTTISGNGAADSAAFAQTAPVYRFNIPAKPIRQAMNDIVRVSGVDVVFSETSAASTVGKPVSGTLTPSQAVAALLSGTGLSYRFTSSNTVTIFDAKQASADGGVVDDGSTVLETITVQGANLNSTIGNLSEAYAGGQVATGAQVGMLGNRTTMNTPFSQTSYTKKKIEDQQAQTLQEVLSNDPSVVVNTQAGGNYQESSTIRGFRQTSNGSDSLNGLVGMLPMNSPSLDYIERVDVLRGPSALLNGMSSYGTGGIGGAVNLQTKQADDEPLTQLTTDYTSRSQVGAHVDFGRRFGDDKQFGLRFNGAFRKGDTPIDPQSAEIGSVALNLDYRGERVRISADIVHQSDEANPGNFQLLNIARVGVVPHAPDAGTSLNPSWSEHRVKGTMAMVRGEVDITDNITAYGAIGKVRTETLFNTPFVPMLLGASGNYGWAGLYSYHTNNDVLSMQTGLRATASTGPVDHKLSLNLSRSVMAIEPTLGVGAYSYTTNIYDPVFGPAPIFSDLPSVSALEERKMSSIGFADTMSILDDSIQFTAGLRYQKVEISGTPDYVSDAWTPAFALVAKPRDNVSVYANYIQALQTGQIVGSSYANVGEVLPPYLSEQYEAGVKVDWGAVTTTLAIFQITQANTVAIPDLDTGLSKLAANGEQRNRGVELNAYGEVIDGVRLLGGVTFLDARQAKTQDGLYDGKRAQGAPKFRTVVGAEWDTPFLEGLTLTGRVNYTDKQVVSNTNENLNIPSWTTLDLGARYTFNSPWNWPAPMRWSGFNLNA